MKWEVLAVLLCMGNLGWAEWCIHSEMSLSWRCSCYYVFLGRLGTWVGWDEERTRTDSRKHWGKGKTLWFFPVQPESEMKTPFQNSKLP